MWVMWAMDVQTIQKVQTSNARCRGVRGAFKLVSEWKQARGVFNEKWRGSFATLLAAGKACIHLCTLQGRMKGPRCDGFGPWSPLWQLDARVSGGAHAMAMQTGSGNVDLLVHTMVQRAQKV